jgi:hypothetical protein
MSQLSDHEFERLITLISLPPDAKIAWDFACFGEIIEEIPDYKGHPHLVSMKLKCFHCGKIHTYGNLPKVDVQGAFYMPCRSCGRLTTYGKYINFNYELLCQWMKNEAKGIKLSDWIEKNSIKKLIIYGLGDLGIVLYKYLEDSGIVVTVTDQNPQAVTVADTWMKNVKFTDVNSISTVGADLVLIAPSYAHREIKESLLKNGCRCRIESLFDVVFGIVDFCIHTFPSHYTT